MTLWCRQFHHYHIGILLDNELQHFDIYVAREKEVGTIQEVCVSATVRASYALQIFFLSQAGTFSYFQ